MEYWLEVTGYEGKYEVSNLGRIKSLLSNRILKDSRHRDGYKKVILHYKGERKTFQVHRLVAIAFIHNHENKPQVNHKNGIKDDNRVENLEWVTVSENTKHAYDNGMAKSNGGLNQKPVNKIDPLTNKVICTFQSMTDASISNGNKNRASILDAINKDSIYLGYKWEFSKVNK